MSSCSTPASCFENLPVELHRIILGLLPDFSSLRSVVNASRKAQAAYSLASQSIQSSVFERVLSNSPHLATESQGLHEAAYIRCNDSDWHDSMDNFLTCRQPDIKEQNARGSPEDMILEGVYFHNVVEDFTSAFLKGTMQSHQDGLSRRSKGNLANFPLQHAEYIRIQRALYRFQRICQTYPRNMRPSQGGARTPAEHPLADFVRGLPSWELEELHCIYRFLISKLSFLDDSAYIDFVSGQSLEKGLKSYRYKEHVVSLGLIFLRQLVNASMGTQLALLKQYCGPDSHSLSDVLPLGGTNTSIGLHASSRSLNTQSLFGPSAGWVLYRPPSAKDRGRAPMSELRDWGYCFWERDRLRAWGVCKGEEEPTDPSSWIQRIRDTGEALQLWRRL